MIIKINFRPLDKASRDLLHSWEFCWRSDFARQSNEGDLGTARLLEIAYCILTEFSCTLCWYATAPRLYAMFTCGQNFLDQLDSWMLSSTCSPYINASVDIFFFLKNNYVLLLLCHNYFPIPTVPSLNEKRRTTVSWLGRSSGARWPAGRLRARRTRRFKGSRRS